MYSINKHMAIQNLKIESMTLKEITDLLGVRHDNAVRLVKELVQNQEFGTSPQIEVLYKVNNGAERVLKTYRLNKRQSLAVASRLNIELLMKLVDRWQYLEDELDSLKRKSRSKETQLEAMERLSYLLPDGLDGVPLSYIKANVIVNKATSNLYGFSKLLKKDEMDDEMLESRELVMKDYLSLFEVLEGSSEVKDLLYNKWQPKRLENLND